MQTITIAAASEHGLAFTTLAALLVSIVVVGLVAWQLVSRMRMFRHDDRLGHQGR